MAGPRKVVRCGQDTVNGPATPPWLDSIQITVGRVAGAAALRSRTSNSPVAGGAAATIVVAVSTGPPSDPE